MKLSVVYYIWSGWETFASIRLPLLQEFSKIWGEEIQILCVKRAVDFLLTPIVNRWRMRNWISNKGKISSLSENMFVFTPVVAIHDRAAHLIPFMESVNAGMLHRQISCAIKRLRPKPERIIHWFSHPLQYHYLKSAKADLTIYHCTDDWAAWPGLSRIMRLLIPPREEMMSKAVDLVFTSSRKLFEKARLFNKHVYLFPGSADTEFFGKALNKDLKIPVDMACIRKPIIGFSGSIFGITDLTLIGYLASRHPEWSFVLIGPVASNSVDQDEFRRLLRFANVHYLGCKEYKHLPNYFKAFDVCLAPYNSETYSESVFPNKVFQYLAAGKPVVSIGLPEMEHLEEVVRVVHDYVDFEREICLALTNNDSNAIQHRVLIAQNNSLTNRVNSMSQTIWETLDGVDEQFGYKYHSNKAAHRRT